MPKVVKVTRAQIRAAQALIKMYERGHLAEAPSPAVRAIAAAKRKVRRERDVVFEEA